MAPALEDTSSSLHMARAESLDGAASNTVRRPSDPLITAAADASVVPWRAFAPVGSELSSQPSHAMLLLPSDGGAESIHVPPRPLSAADMRASSLAQPDPRAMTSGDTSPMHNRTGPVSRSHSPYLRRARRDEGDDPSRVTLHGAAAGAHAAGDERTQLVVHNLPPHVRWQDVKDLFRRAGTVLRADVHANLQDPRTGASVGTVLFATETDAHRAIDTLHGYTWHGRILEVVLDQDLIPSDKERVPARASSEADGLYARAPAVPPPTSHEGADTMLPGASLSTAPGMAPRACGDAWSVVPLPYPGRVLFVGNLPFHCQWQDLKDLFRAAGNIQRADVALNAEGRSRGFGTVLFASPEDAQTAVRLYHGYEYSGRTLKVHFDRHAHYGPTVPGIPTDPLQYTAAFQVAGTSMPANGLSGSPLPLGILESHDAWGAPPPSDLAPRAAGVPHPGRIALPPLSFPTPAPMTPGVPLTPGMPSFLMRSVLETPPIYPYMMSPGVAFTPAGMPYMNAAPGAPLDPTTGLPSYLPSGMNGFAPTSNHVALPPTPHWSQQPTRPRARTGSVSRMTVNRDAPAPVGTQRTGLAPGEYPFPVASEQAVKAHDDAPPAHGTPATAEAEDASVLPSTRDLTNAIAKLSVRGTARTKQSPDDLSERAAAGEALSRLRRDLAAKEVTRGAAATPSMASPPAAASQAQQDA
ncbi:hypothetical protein MEQU1_002480 [Malassezia equina]|uniref:RRM domain-containing protein n=1 Tax=Malassezia equina TaxID=1381935 RepID=A0AAF0EFT5_9BASI|nr:hypothetical protein MEQU1_002480 [Malassezia equina]